MATVAMAATRTSIEEEKFYTFSIGNARTECNSEFSSNKHSADGRNILKHLSWKAGLVLFWKRLIGNIEWSAGRRTSCQLSSDLSGWGVLDGSYKCWHPEAFIYKSVSTTGLYLKSFVACFICQIPSTLADKHDNIEFGCTYGNTW